MFIEGAMTFSLITLIIMSLSINDLSITIKNTTPRITTLGITTILSAVYAGCLVSDIVMLSVSECIVMSEMECQCC